MRKKTVDRTELKNHEDTNRNGGNNDAVNTTWIEWLYSTKFIKRTNNHTNNRIHTNTSHKSRNHHIYVYQITATITMPQIGTQTATIKIWQKAPYLKVEMNGVAAGMTNTITIIQRPEGTYTYDTAQGKYVLTTDDVPSFATSLQYFNPEMIKKYLNNQSLTHFETETIDGKKATIIQYTPAQGENQITVKIWIWNEEGVPLKAYINMVLEEYTMTMDFNFNNYSFADISDSTFSVS